MTHLLLHGVNLPPDSIVDYALLTNVSFNTSAVPQPRNVKAYVLPGAASAPTDQAPPAGLTWTIPPPGDGPQQPTAPVMFHLRRAYLGSNAAPDPSMPSPATW